jgi:hypothetical protein
MSEQQPIDLDDLQRVGVLVRKLTDDNWLADMVEIAAAEIARLREERRSISTLLGKVESLEADNARLREERLTNEERGAIHWGTAALLDDADIAEKRGMAQRSQHSREAAETLKRLLDRQPLPGPGAK